MDMTESGKQMGIKHIILKVPFEMHRDIKLRTTQRNVSIKAWVLQAIIDRIKAEDSSQ